MSLFVFQIAIIFVPGIIWAKMESTYTSGPKITDTELFINALVFGLFTYLTTFILYKITCNNFDLIDIVINSKDENSGKLFDYNIADEIMIGIAVGFILLITWLYCKNFKLLPRFLQFIRATNKFGIEDVWEFTLNSPDAASEYTHIRDLDQGLIFAGWVNKWSDNQDIREIVLRDVIVYNDKSDKLFDCPYIYLARERNKITMEFPSIGEQNERKTQKS